MIIIDNTLRINNTPNRIYNLLVLLKKNDLKIKDVFQFSNFLKEYEIAFYIHTFCSIAITILVSSAAYERIFSCMKRVNSYLRNILLDINFTGLSIISIKKREAKSLVTRQV